MSQIYIEYALHDTSDQIVLRLGNSIFEVQTLNRAAIETIRETLHKQAVAECNKNVFSRPHASACVESSYLQIVTLAPFSLNPAPGGKGGRA